MDGMQYDEPKDEGARWMLMGYRKEATGSRRTMRMGRSQLMVIWTPLERDERIPTLSAPRVEDVGT